MKPFEKAELAELWRWAYESKTITPDDGRRIQDACDRFHAANGGEDCICGLALGMLAVGAIARA